MRLNERIEFERNCYVRKIEKLEKREIENMKTGN